MNEQLLNRIRQCPNLPSLPAIAVQILDLARHADTDIAEIARLISKDPALSSKILRTVNSSFYGCSKHISTISHALVILGLQSVKTLVLGFSLVPGLTKNSSRGFKHVTYWKRSLYTATAARIIATKMQVAQQEEIFLAGLLTDIGMLVFDQVLGTQYGELCSKAASHTELVTAERDQLGMTHAEGGGFLAQHWNLPPMLNTPIAHHHDPSVVQDEILRAMTEIISLAGRCADVFVDADAATPITAVRKILLEHHQIPEPDADLLLDEIGRRTKEAAALFEVNIGAAANYEEILKKANETLVEITLQTQQQATNLQEQNQKLKQQAMTDGLTGLSNRAHFDLFLGEQFANALRTARPISLLMMDLDNFKKINDTHGHQAGDMVLMQVGKLLRAAARAQDLAARYGGEETTLVLPMTTRSSAAAVAEIIRRAVEKRPLVHNGVSIPVTISIGVASFEPGSPFRDASHLIKAADLAVYAAKHGGKNCVKVFSLKPAA